MVEDGPILKVSSAGGPSYTVEAMQQIADDPTHPQPDLGGTAFLEDAGQDGADYNMATVVCESPGGRTLFVSVRMHFKGSYDNPVETVLAAASEVCGQVTLFDSL